MTALNCMAGNDSLLMWGLFSKINETKLKHLLPTEGLPRSDKWTKFVSFSVNNYILKNMECLELRITFFVFEQMSRLLQI